MSASKIKNLILLILLLGVLGLLPAVVPTQAARTGAERNVHEKLEELYSSYGLTLDASSLPDSQTLYAIELENPDASNAAQALLGSKAVSQETSARGLASYTSELGSMQLSRSGELTARLTGASQAHDLARATRRYLRSMDFDLSAISEPLRESAGVYSVTAVQSLCGVPVFESALTFTYRNSALSRVDGTFYPAGETVRVSENACISCGEAKSCPASRGTFTRKRPRARCALCRSGGSKRTRARSMSAVLRARYVSWCRKGANVRVEILKNL